jgi:NYN domain
MNAENLPRRRVAVMIDGENVGTEIAPTAFAEALKRGDIVVSRAYGNVIPRWESYPDVEVVHVQRGKNSADIALSLDALEFALTGKVDCVIIASRDSDFAHVAKRLVRLGIETVGVGSFMDRPSLFVQACSSYVPVGVPRRMSEEKINAKQTELLPLMIAFTRARCETAPQHRMNISDFGTRAAVVAGISRERAGATRAHGWLHYLKGFPDVFEVHIEQLGTFVSLKGEAARLHPLPKGIKVELAPTPGFEDRFLTFVRKQASHRGWFELRRLGGKRARRAKITKAHGGIKASKTWVQWLEERAALFEFRPDGKAIKPRKNPGLVLHQMMSASAITQATPTPIPATATAAEPASLA